MITHNLCRRAQLLIVLSVHLAHAATDAGVGTQPPATAVNPTNGPFSPTTSEPADGTTLSSTTFGSTETTDVSQNPTSISPTDETSSATVGPTTQSLPPATTSQPVVIPTVCLCDLTPGLCDIGCCCDVADCGVLDLRTVFSGCPRAVVSGDCIEKWLMFKANINPSFVTVTDTLFCVQLGPDNTPAPQSLPASSQTPSSLDLYHFSWQEPAYTKLHTRPFYRVDDVILTHYGGTSVRSLLRQPSPGSASSSCTDLNPAKFLRSESLSCSRSLTPQRCVSDPSLNALSYYTDLSLIKVPVPDSVNVSDLLIPVTALSDWPAPKEENGTCLNVVSKVQYVIGFTGRGQLSYASLSVVLMNTSVDSSLTQQHSVLCQVHITPQH